MLTGNHSVAVHGHECYTTIHTPLLAHHIFHTQTQQLVCTQQCVSSQSSLLQFPGPICHWWNEKLFFSAKMHRDNIPTPFCMLQAKFANFFGFQDTPTIRLEAIPSRLFMLHYHHHFYTGCPFCAILSIYPGLAVCISSGLLCCLEERENNNYANITGNTCAVSLTLAGCFGFTAPLVFFRISNTALLKTITPICIKN